MPGMANMWRWSRFHSALHTSSTQKAPGESCVLASCHAAALKVLLIMGAICPRLHMQLAGQCCLGSSCSAASNIGLCQPSWPAVHCPSHSASPAFKYRRAPSPGNSDWRQPALLHLRRPAVIWRAGLVDRIGVLTWCAGMCRFSFGVGTIPIPMVNQTARRLNGAYIYALAIS